MLGEATPEDSPVGLKSLTQPRLSQLEPPPPHWKQRAQRVQAQNGFHILEPMLSQV